MTGFKACSILIVFLTLVFTGCNSANNCDTLGGCLPECINQGDCSNNQTCLNEGICACFAGQNGADCSDSADCEPDEICSADCQCVPPPLTS